MSVADRLSYRLAIGASVILLACGLMLPSVAFAETSINGNPLNQGVNNVGENGTATLSETVLDLVNIVADSLDTTDSLTINFNGGNEIDNTVVSGSATVEMNFTGENEVEHIYTYGDANLTVNVDEHNDFDEIGADDNSKVTLNVTGENDFDVIYGYGNSSITVRGTGCQKDDIINLGEDDDYGDGALVTQSGDLTIDHVTINLQHEDAEVGSMEGNVVIDTSKIAKDGDNKYTWLFAKGTMTIKESVIDIVGTIVSVGKMTIEHSDVKVGKPDAEYDEAAHRVFSETDIELIREKNGKVKEGEIYGYTGKYLDTDDNDGVEVDLKADGKPAYYKCCDDCDDDDDSGTKPMPKTGDADTPLWPMTAASAGVVAAAWVVLRRREFARR